MMRLVLAGVLCVCGSILVGCSQKYYCKLFRVETVQSKSDVSFSKDLLDGRFGSVADSEMFIRVVALWDSNNKSRLANTSYSVSVQQRARGSLTDTLQIDSIVIVFQPSGERYVLPKTSVAVMTGDYVPEPLVKTTFTDLVIPDGVESVDVSLTVRRLANAQSEQTREFSFSMIRYQGEVEKFGYRPRD